MPPTRHPTGRPTLRRSNTVVVLLAKHWTPGQVKTRLAQALGPRRAARIHRLFVEVLLRRMAPGAEWDGVLALWPPQHQREMAQAAEPFGWQTLVQVPGDLGRRMHHVACWALEQGYRRVVLLGADAPDVPRPWVGKALDLLRHKAVVVGPAQDGGYWLLGLARDVPELFAGIPWSTPHVYNATLNRLKALALPWATLPQWSDVDRPDDLEALLRRLQRAGEVELRRLGERISAVLRAER